MLHQHPNQNPRTYEGLDIEKDKFVMWLHGPAGGGKTAIGRTIAKWCEEEGILLGEFFFSRADGTGAQLASLAPTLAYRMAVHSLQDAKEVISDVINHDPHIFLAPLAIQLKKLVIEPLNLLAPSSIVPYVIILDGLDEALSSDDQQLLLDVISETLYQFNPTLRILICCRPEPTIVTAFNDADSLLNSISTIISLNDDADADADIRTFLVEKFARTKKQLPHFPNEDWPTAENIDYLVTKSSGQFIFAATAERYVCSPMHRHQAVARLKHVLDLKLLSHLEDKKKHPFADLDALYHLILRTRSDVNMSVNATAVCLEYPNYFIAVSPADLSKVLNIELSETWAILYELASLFDTSKESIRPFHASFGDFLFDSSRSADFFRNGGDIAADITCAMLRQGRDPEVLSYHAFSRLLGDATPRQDLRDTLSRMEPISVFRRPASTREYDQRSKGAYYLIPLLRQLKKKNHVSPDTYKSLVTYFDEQFELFLPFGYWSSMIFSEVIIKNKRNRSPDSDDSMPALHSVADALEDDSEYVSEDSKQVLWREKPKASRSPTYMVSKLIPLSTSPVWDEINASLNIRLTGSDSLTGFWDEAHFTRSRLKKTLSVLLEGSTQTKAALFCLMQIQSEDISEDLQIAFAKLLPHSLLHAEKLPELKAAIMRLRSQDIIYQRLPMMTRKAITVYLVYPPSTSGSSSAARTVPNISSTRLGPGPRPSDTITESSTQATIQKPSTTLNSFADNPQVQSSGTNFFVNAENIVITHGTIVVSEHPTPSQAQPVPQTSQTQPSPSAFQKAQTQIQHPDIYVNAQNVVIAGSTFVLSEHSTPSQAQPVPQTSQIQPSPSAFERVQIQIQDSGFYVNAQNVVITGGDFFWEHSDPGHFADAKSLVITDGTFVDSDSVFFGNAQDLLITGEIFVSEQLTPSQAQPVPRISQTEPSPSASQKAQTTSRPPPSTQPAPFTFQPSSLNIVQNNSAVSRTPKEPSNNSQPATPDPKSSTARGPPTVSCRKYSFSVTQSGVLRAISYCFIFPYVVDYLYFVFRSFLPN